MEIRCRDQCGAVAIVDGNNPPPGDWTYLEGSRAWRCARCVRDLQNVVGCETTTYKDIPPDSRGAIPKATAHTILPPSVPA